MDTPRSLAWFLRRHVDDGGQMPSMFSLRIDWFPQWCANNPDDEQLFKQLLADAIVHQTVPAYDLSRVAGHVTPNASPADVDETLRRLWFELWPDDPIPGDLHPLPDWWPHWMGTPYLSTVNAKAFDSLEEIVSELDEEPDWDGTDVAAYLERHRLTWDAVVNFGQLYRFFYYTHQLRHYRGYRRMLWARWDAGDRTAIPTVPPDPADVEEALNWVDWHPGPSA